MKQLDAYDQRRANRAKENVEAGLKAVEKVKVNEPYILVDGVQVPNPKIKDIEESINLWNDQYWLLTGIDIINQ